MTQLQLNTEDLRSAAARFKSEAGEMESAVSSADSSFAPCRDHISPRIQQDVQQWDTLKSKFKTALEELVASAEELVRAAEDNELANKPR
jgi:hypothetical protein